VLEAAGIDMFIVGDSLGMVLKGHESTVPVTMADMLYHGANVARVGRHALRVVDMPYMSYANPEQALGNAARLVAEGGADMVKLEGGQDKADIVRHLGYHVQGRDEAGASALLTDAQALEAAGATLLVMECIPAELAALITSSVSMPTIGIGAGPDCDGQVLVLYDMLGITPGKVPKFVRNFLQDAGSVPAAIRAYVDAVKNGSFPAPEHCF
jgi:3-methyl-2-oxobutanoate hydroxymethyltransferase